MSITQHPLTHEQAVTLWNSTKPPCAWESVWNLNGVQLGLPHPLLAPLRAAFDAGREHERANALTDGADRPWEPLNGPVRVGDEVRQDLRNVTVIAVVGWVDADGDPWATADRFIGRLDSGTWHVRRHIQELPAEPGAVIVPADGRDYIEATTGNGETFRAREAIRSRPGSWYAAWRSGERPGRVMLPQEITPGTWKVDDQ